MRWSFFVAGSMIKGHSLGEIGMRQIAPTLTKITGGSLPDAELGPLPLN